MLEFIVLGQIPGTNIQMSFSGVLLILVIVLLAYELSYRYHSVKPYAVTQLKRLLQLLKPLA